MQIYTSYSDGRLTLYVQGELDHHEAKNAMDTIEKLLIEYMPRECVLELSKLNFMDSSGIALIVKVFRRLREMRGQAWIENASGQPLKVIDAASIERIMKMSVTKES